MMNNEYDAIVLTTPESFERLWGQYHYLLKYLPVRNVFILGSRQVGMLLDEKKEQILNLASDIGSEIHSSDMEKTGIYAQTITGENESTYRLKFIDEDDILPFDRVHTVMRREMEPLLQGRELPRGITGWYYQQFLKLSYSRMCRDEFYLVWDGDTFPCRDFSMFSDPSSGAATPYLDIKHETHTEYFETMGILISGMEKVIGPSFISEHMLFKCEYVNELLTKMESNVDIPGEAFWEKVIHAVGKDRMQDSSFSEYETYGTFIAQYHPSAYRLREWHSFRLGAEFFDPQTISPRDYEWLGRDFTAISFEKNQSVREDHRNLFDNPMYQEKLTAKQMLQIVQEELEGGYKEVWGDETGGNNETSGGFD